MLLKGLSCHVAEFSCFFLLTWLVYSLNYDHVAWINWCWSRSSCRSKMLNPKIVYATITEQAMRHTPCQHFANKLKGNTKSQSKVNLAETGTILHILAASATSLYGSLFRLQVWLSWVIPHICCILISYIPGQKFHLATMLNFASSSVNISTTVDLLDSRIVICSFCVLLLVP